MTTDTASGADVKTQPDSSSTDVNSTEPKKADNHKDVDNKDKKPDNQQTASGSDVKSANTDKSQADSVKNMDVDPEDMAEWGGIPMPRTLLNDIRKNTRIEERAKYRKELEETGELLTDEQKKIIDQYHLVMKPLGEALKPGQPLAPSEIDKIINDRIEDRTETLKSQLDKEKAEKENIKMQLLNKNNELEENKIRQRVSKGLTQHPNFNVKHLNRAIQNVINDGFIKVDDVTQEPIVITPEGARKHNPETNKPWIVEDYIEKAWLSENDIFLTFQDNSNAGSPLGGEPGSGQPKIGLEQETPKFSVDRSSAVPSTRR